MTKNKISKSTQHEISCNNCGAKLHFAPGTDSLKCHFCDTLNEIKVDEDAKKEAIKGLDLNTYILSQENIAPKIEITTVKCDSCGAETSFNPNFISDKCDFCGSPLVSNDAHTSKIIAPKAMLPFKINKREAFNLYKTWLQKLWFAPNKLKKLAKQSDDLAGIYAPYWIYATDTKINYTGNRGDDFKVTKSYNENEPESRTETKWTKVKGEFIQFFDKILVPASSSLPNKHIDQLEPWDLHNLVPYDTKYLAGFKTETYQTGLPEGFSIAKKRIEFILPSIIKKHIGGDYQEISTTNIEYSKITFKHILLPIWLNTYKYNDKIYRFIINARTGDIRGDRPYSWIKITLLIITIVALISTLIVGNYWYSEIFQK